MVELPTGTVTLLFTDIESSTRLLHQLGDRYGNALEQHRALLREAFTSHGGVEVDTQGDAFFYAFPTPHEALKAAVQAQKALSDHPWPNGAELRVRIGIHTGTPEVTEQGYVGADVHLAARVCSAAHGGQVLVSDATAGLLAPGLEGIALRSLGEHRLKDIHERVVLHQMVTEGLASDFPPLRTPSGAHPTNLPSRLPPLIGRDDELSALQGLLASPEASVVTLVGPGGTGKTTLAAAVGAELLSSYPDGVFFVDLSALTDASLVVPAIAQALSLRETPGRSLNDTLAEHLSSQEMLLILDNFEQVIAAAPTVSSLATTAPALKVIVTSREALRIQGEKEFPVAPLALPASPHDPEAVADSPAVALFVSRAQDARPDFHPSPSELTVVADICRRLDGLPLAIELAAARIKMLSLPALNERLGRSLKVLSSRRRDAAERQRTLRGAIAWSYDLLTPDEQALFRRLGVFAGGLTLDAAEEVCDPGYPDTDVLDGLASLVDKSLLRTDRVKERFSMLETIRQFAKEKLEESGEVVDIRRAHAEFFRAFAEEADRRFVRGDQQQWLDRLDEESWNIRVALDWAARDDPELALHLAAGAWRVWYVRGYISEGRRILDELLSKAVNPSPERMRAFQAASALAEAQDDFPRATAYAHEALSLARRFDADADAGRALLVLSTVAQQQGDVTAASPLLEEALSLAESVGDQYLLVRVRSHLATLRAQQGEYEESISLNERTAEIAAAAGDKRGRMMALVGLGEDATIVGRLDQAERALREGLDLANEVGDAFAQAAGYINLGLLSVSKNDMQAAEANFRAALERASELESTYLLVSCLDGLAATRSQGDCEGAAWLLAISDGFRERTGLTRSTGEEQIYGRYIAAIGEQVGERELEDLTRAASSMAPPDAVEAALKRRPHGWRSGTKEWSHR